MRAFEDYSQQSVYSDPGKYATLLDPLPTDIRALTAVVRNVLVHYRAAGFEFEGKRLAEIDSRWVEQILDTDQSRHGMPLSEPRGQYERVATCCRDFTLLTVAALRHQGVPARSRVGFAEYFTRDFGNDHVIVEYWNGDRWVFTDAELEAGEQLPFDPADIPYLVGAKPESTPHFRTAAQAWTAFRAGELDADRYGVAPDLPYRGDWFVRNYVVMELAHRQRDELLLWDNWGAMGNDLSGDLGLIDEIAALLLAADDGDEAAERELAERYASDSALRPGERVICTSPTGVLARIDLTTRQPAI
ncbi:transglutaminase-like domain-containing protein [Flindersiella endophytica]